MSSSRKLLVVGGLGLAVLGMTYGLWYAVFIEHQTLDAVGGSLTNAFIAGAKGDAGSAARSINDYGTAAYAYVRQVDAHSHWIGLAMLLLMLGVVFDRVAFGDRARLWLAIMLVAGSALFPGGVLLQTVLLGPLPQVVAIVGSVLVIGGLGGIAVGFARAH